ncbi:MAG: macrolide ABC transporter ATP-binding protein [Chloroflexi bacterium]|nr:MAG: macrolide ABC transporter ATP-binding protein [Chloroflexota bacterium]HDN79910.1 ABC transporter ATP-binding protein [Chloroflexota bacterium]
MAETIVRTEDLWKEFPMGSSTVQALKGVNIEVEKGEFLCVMGPSGSGKSTLLNLIGGLDRPTRGRVIVKGKDLASLDENALALYRRQEVGFVFQAFNLIATMTALQNVELPMVFARVPYRHRHKRARELLEMVGLGHRLYHRANELSGGEQQRVAIARALANAPSIILADEPTGNLDSRTGSEILELLRELNRSKELTVIVVSHNPMVMSYAHRVVHLRDGEIAG